MQNIAISHKNIDVVLIKPQKCARKFVFSPPNRIIVQRFVRFQVPYPYLPLSELRFHQTKTRELFKPSTKTHNTLLIAERLIHCFCQILEQILRRSKIIYNNERDNHILLLIIS